MKNKYTIAMMHKECGIPVRTIEHHILTGKLPAQRIADRCKWYIREADAHRYMEAISETDNSAAAK